MFINAHKTQVHTEGGILADQSQRLQSALLDFWRGAHQVRHRLRHRPARLCVDYGVGLTQKYKVGLTVLISSLVLLWLFEYFK